MRAWRCWLPVVALTVLGVALRLPTLDRQSFWLDELVTVSLLDRALGDIVREVPRTEATPYLYYVLAWAWSSLFGLAEIGLRSLSALVGTVTIPVTYGAGAVLVSRRAGIAAAALVATNPFLVWYSQEARSYALLAFLCAVSVLGFGLALRGTRGGLAGWAVVAALAIATHYFAVFVVVAEAAWLLLRARPAGRRATIVACLLPGATVVAQLPLLLSQRGNGEAVAGSSLASRIAGIPENLVIGYSFPAEVAGSVLAASLVLLGAVLVVRLRAPERRRALVAGSLAAAAVLTPIALALAGADFLIARNTIAAVVPAAVCLGAGYAAGRTGIAAATALCGLSTTVAVARAVDRAYGRTDWRGAARALQDAGRVGPRAVVVTPYMSRTLWRPYLPGLREPGMGGAAIREIAAVELATGGGYSAARPAPPLVSTPRPVAGFRVVAVERKPTFTLVLYRAGRPTVVPISTLPALALGTEQPGILLLER